MLIMLLKPMGSVGPNAPVPSEAPLGSPSPALEAERRRASTKLYYPSFFAARGAERRTRRPVPQLALLSATLARGAHREIISSSSVLGDQRPVTSFFLEVVRTIRASFFLEDDRILAPERHDHLA